MTRKSLYVTVTAECEGLGTIFPQGSEWEFTDSDEQDNGTSVVRYEWNGDYQSVIESRLNSNPEVISYQIL